MPNPTIRTDTSIQERDLGGGNAGKTIGGLQNLEIVEDTKVPSQGGGFAETGADEEIAAPSSLVRAPQQAAATGFDSVKSSIAANNPARIETKTPEQLKSEYEKRDLLNVHHNRPSGAFGTKAGYTIYPGSDGTADVENSSGEVVNQYVPKSSWSEYFGADNNQQASGYQEPVRQETAVKKEATRAPQKAPKAQSPYIPTETATTLDGTVSMASRLSPQPSYAGDHSRFVPAAVAAKDSARDAVHAKKTVVSASDIVTKLVAEPHANVGIEEVSLGDNLLLECVRQQGNQFLDRVNKAMQKLNARPESVRVEDYQKDNWTTEDFMTDEATVMNNLGMLTEQVNRSNLWVTMTKSPTTMASSYQARILRIHEGDGIVVHPLAVKAFNADFDGDGSTLHLTGENMHMARSAIYYLIDQDGQARLDGDLIMRMDTASAESIYDMFESVLGGITDSWRRVADAYIEYCYDENMTDFVQKLDSIITESNNLGSRPRALAAAVNGLYRAITDVYRNRIADMELVESDFEVDHKNIVGDLNPEEAAVLKVYADAKAGKMPPSYQDFVAQSGFFVGDVAKKNTQFRVGANISKLIKRSSKTYIGSNAYYELWHDTAMACVSIAMNAKLYAGENSLSSTEWLRAQVISDCGFPAQSGNIEVWMDKFAKSWNRNIAITNVAAVGWTTSFKRIAGKERKAIPTGNKYYKLGDVVGPIQDIFGDFTVGEIFGDTLSFAGRPKSGAAMQYDSWEDDGWNVLHRYKNVPLYKFCGNNNVRIPLRVREGNVINNKQGWYMLLASMADTATGAAHAYHDDIVEANKLLAQTMKALADIQAGNNDWRDDAKFNKLMYSLEEVLYKTHPTMFAYFNMDSPGGFVDSKWGSLLLENTQNSMSIRYGMVYEWRTDRLRAVQSQLKNATEETAGNIRAQLLAEKNALRSASPVWKMLVDEISSGSKNFKRFMDSEGVMTRKKLNGSTVDSHTAKTTLFREFGPEYRAQWTSVRDFIQDPAVRASQKEAVLCDLIIETGGFINTLPEQIAYQLELDPAASYGGINAAGWTENNGSPLKQSMLDIRNLRDRTLNYVEAINDTESEKFEVTNDVIETVFDEIGAYLGYGRHLYTDVPWAVYSDMIMSPLEKDSNDSEKSSQTALVNAGFNAITAGIDGGMTTEVQYCDNQAMGRVAWYQVTAVDIKKIISGELDELRYYDQYGNPGVITWSTLYEGGLDEQNIWILNQARTDVLPDSDGTTEVVKSHANGFFNYEENDMPESAQTLIDHPGYAALIALFSDVQGKTVPAARSVTLKTAKWLESIMGYALYLETKGGTLKNQPWVKKLNDFLDADRRKWGQDAFVQNLGTEAADLIIKYAHELEEKHVITPSSSKPADPTWTKSSCNLFYDTRQTIAGSKTQSSTGMEGYETERHKLICAYLPTLKDCYRSIADLSEEDQQRLAGAPTTAGVPYVPGMTAETDVYIVDEEMETSDPLLDDRSDTQINAIMRWFNIKRDMSGEGLNLKAKKTGDDKKDSVMKKRKYGLLYNNWAGFEESMDNKYRELIAQGQPQEAAIEAIRIEVAMRLRSADLERDFKDDFDEPFLSVADYLNMARLMVVDIEGYGLTFRSLEQLSAAVASRVPEMMDVGIDFNDQAIEEETMQKFYDLCEEVIKTAGIPNLKQSPKELLSSIRKPGPARGAVGTAYRKRASNLERNLKVLAEGELPVASQDVIEAADTANQKAVFPTKWPKDFKMCGIWGQGEIVASAGIENAVFLLQSKDIETTKKNWMEANDFCKKNGMTLVCDFLISDVGTSIAYREDGQTIVPWFEWTVNRYAQETQYSSFWAPAGSVQWTVEDAHYRYDYPDAGTFGTQSFIDRIQVDDIAPWSMPVDAMFANVQEAFDGCELGYRLASVDEIKNDITMDKLDLRVAQGNNNFKQIRERMGRLVNEFYDNWDGNTPFLKETRPDRVIGFMLCGVRDPYTGQVMKFYSPIIPWESSAGGEDAPATYSVEQLRYDRARGELTLMAKNTSDMAGRFVKTHEGWAAANKEMMLGKPVPNAAFANGVPIDNYVAASSTASRLCGDNKRVATLQGPLFEPLADKSTVSWNAGKIKGFLPNNPEEKAAMLGRHLTIEEWQKLSGTTWFKAKKDKKLNDWVQHTVENLLAAGVNPSYFFCNEFVNEGREAPYKSRMTFEFEALLETDFTWEDNFLKFMHKLDPKLVPDGIHGDSTGCLYKVSTETGDDFGCLMKWVPYPGRQTGGTYEVVRAHYGMFGEDSSAHKRMGYNGSRIENQSLVESIHANMSVPGARLKYLRYALAGHAPNSLKGSSQSVMEFGRR